ncbi:unnamed protein product [Darwinula stevensoni]|uniref:Uncharacterized protein n=1 Tax=Darwinula stevensoni TaxID=69355 RepID=A0A7R8X9V4_9CRUS|nr:unnamed protein product [Darwinula stevensoni]CAG0889349.1 unnamed protein product [Darwinula stevensoni]
MKGWLRKWFIFQPHLRVNPCWDAPPLKASMCPPLWWWRCTSSLVLSPSLVIQKNHRILLAAVFKLMSTDGLFLPLEYRVALMFSPTHLIPPPYPNMEKKLMHSLLNHLLLLLPDSATLAGTEDTMFSCKPLLPISNPATLALCWPVVWSNLQRETEIPSAYLDNVFPFEEVDARRCVHEMAALLRRGPWGYFFMFTCNDKETFRVAPLHTALEEFCGGDMELFNVELGK